MHQENTNNQSRCYNINIKQVQFKVKRIKGEQRNSFILMKRAKCPLSAELQELGSLENIN